MAAIRKQLHTHTVRVGEPIEDGCIDWAYGDIDDIHWSLERGNDRQVIIDMNAYRGEMDDYLDRTRTMPMQDTFWIEPSAIIRAMLGKSSH